MSCTKYMGRCLCARCQALKENGNQVGTEKDLQLRQKLCTPTQSYFQLIDRARNGIFTRGWAVDGKPVNNLLGNKSWTPHRVSCINPGCLKYSFKQRVPFCWPLAPSSTISSYL